MPSHFHGLAVRRQCVVIREYVNQGISGVVASRPVLNRLMEAARRCEFDLLLVWKFDRLEVGDQEGDR